VLHWGVAGAALAMGLANLGVVGYFAVWLARHSEHMSLAPRWFTLSPTVLKPVLGVGVGTLLQSAFLIVTALVLNNLAAAYGDGPLTAMGVAVRIAQVPEFLVMGVTLGVLPLLAYSYGKGDKGRLTSALRASVITVGSIALIFSAAVFVAREQVFSAFVADRSVLALGVTILTAQLVAMIANGFAGLITSLFQATGLAGAATVMSVTQGVLFIPVVILGNYWFGLVGIIWALTVTEVAVFLVGVVMWLAPVARSSTVSPRAARSAPKRRSSRPMPDGPHLPPRPGHAKVPLCRTERDLGSLSGRRYRARATHRQDVLDQRDQYVLRRLTVTGVAAHHGHVAGDRERVANILGVVVLHTVEAVDGDQVRQPSVLEEVDGGEAVGEPTRVHHHHRTDGTTDQLVPHEPEPRLARRAEQIEDQIAVDADPAEVHGHRGRRLTRHLPVVVDTHTGRGHDRLGGQRGDLRDRPHQRRFTDAEATGDDNLRRCHAPRSGTLRHVRACEVHSAPFPAVPCLPRRSRLPARWARTPRPGHQRPCRRR